MASTTFPTSCTTTIFPSKNSSSLPHFLHKPIKTPLVFNVNTKPPTKLPPCRASDSSDQNPGPQTPTPRVDRRNVLLGLGGLYGAYNYTTYNNNSNAVASPVPPPDVSKCGPATITNTTDKVPYSCCPPPFSGDAVDYELPSFSRLNVRPAAHAVQEEQLEKYKTAVRRMRELPDDDPRSFYQQANVHCAYCNGAYKLAGGGGQDYQIHFSWLFFPFHRWYLYFHERILQSLIGDPTFTIPYWNWDNPQGMFLPEIFDETGSPLYDEVRNQGHRRNGFLLDLAYSAGEVVLDASESQILRNNLAVMYRQMVTNAPCPSLFFGNALRGEGYDTSSGGGTIESVPHNTIHRWVGDPRTAHNEDMGNFYSAALDPIFYSHHWNVDRMWALWKTLGGRRDITDSDWLQSEFVFYDENKTLVKVKVQDCLEHERLGYTFQTMPAPWRDFRPTTRKRARANQSSSRVLIPLASKVLPVALDRTITFKVRRPRAGRSMTEKEEQEEVLGLGLTYDETKSIRFDLFINEDNGLKAFELDQAEYLGSFANLAHIHERSGRDSDDNKPKTTTFNLAITEVLEDLELEFDGSITVTLVPKLNGDDFITVTSAVVSLVAC
ncbi:unnamed protein product [Cuscuta campestris]|uniref:catechol oxidase n=1 Tax=Cuscuta campestris TaxID=132261 RepID=A0A484KTH3_9ASTE|nr:unnamed protein product [Cuscuta campestris]